MARIFASGSQSTLPPTNAIDGKPDTRWSNLGLGSSITLDLDTEKSLCSVDISWYRGNERTNTFTISVSDDGKSFTNVFSGKSSGTTTDFEKYDIKDTNARYVRITVTGNTQSDWVSISEISVFGVAITSPPPPQSSDCDSNLPVSAVTASGSESPNIPSNAIDNNIATRWSNQGVGSWIQLDLGSQKTVRSVDISWPRGNERQYSFNIALSNDVPPSPRFSQVRAAAQLLRAENYRFADTQGRYVKITVNGNNLNDWANISELDIFGPTDTTPPAITGTNPEDGSINVEVNSTITASFSEQLSSSSVTTDTFTLSKPGSTSDIAGTVSLSSDGKTASFQPSADLEKSTTYVATLSIGVKDLAGNQLSQAKSWTFTTISDFIPSGHMCE